MTRLSAAEAARWRERRAAANRKTKPCKVRKWAENAKPGDTYLLTKRELSENPTSPRYTYNWGRRYGLWLSVESNHETGERLYTKMAGPIRKTK